MDTFMVITLNLLGFGDTDCQLDSLERTAHGATRIAGINKLTAKILVEFCLVKAILDILVIISLLLHYQKKG